MRGSACGLIVCMHDVTLLRVGTSYRQEANVCKAAFFLQTPTYGTMT